jgi:hypothetical protein
MPALRSPSLRRLSTSLVLMPVVDACYRPAEGLERLLECSPRLSYLPNASSTAAHV